LQTNLKRPGEITYGELLSGIQTLLQLQKELGFSESAIDKGVSVIEITIDMAILQNLLQKTSLKI